VLDGLQSGESVVIDGADRLKDGAKVTVAASDGGSQKEPGQPQTAAADPEAGTSQQPAQPQTRRQEGQGSGRRNTR
jgi:membrane fusion protein, multidrug efflux system